MANGSTVTVNPAATESGHAVPLVIDLGKKKRKQVKELRKGKGPLVETVLETLDDLRKSGHVSEAAQPVIVIVEQNRKNRMGTFWW